jgi:hypothetical protein
MREPDFNPTRNPDAARQKPLKLAPFSGDSQKRRPETSIGQAEDRRHRRENAPSLGQKVVILASFKTRIRDTRHHASKRRVRTSTA